jgi:hypothetical protein
VLALWLTTLQGRSAQIPDDKILYGVAWYLWVLNMELFHAIFLAPRNFRWLVDIWKICATLGRFSKSLKQTVGVPCRTKYQGLCHNRSKICALLGNYAAYSGNCLPTFRDNLSIPTSRVKNLSSCFHLLGFLTLENETIRLFRNVGKELPLFAA